ncbi:MAG TPA: nicotinate-nucleotide--dimethylbenzimidazole phosphoribosyltransferase [Verrucomicrobiae bacterium]|nr:nicotinate-nucleotide--dimethylbenzimidazole phosphoribosyltransferase [Verrucomicrobiae bacterium]
MTLEAIERIRPVDAGWMERARARQLELTKPPESLGRLEEIANRLAAIQRTLKPKVEKPRIVVFAADHGVCAEGVNPYPQAVTAQMVVNFLRGGAAINALARAAGVELDIVDAGVASEIPYRMGLVSRPVGRGTRNFCDGPAMTREQAVTAITLGAEMAEAACAGGCTLLGMGEMGIGNTTAASAVTAALTGLPAAAVIGRGTGADEGCMAKKRSAVERAMERHRDSFGEPMGILERVGGFEIGAMCGLCLGAAANSCAVLVDGFIATAAAALAVRFCGQVRDYLIAAHRSTEPGHGPLLEILGQRPLLDLEMRLGEGTGAALAVPVVRAAVEAFTHMATFAAAGVSEAAEPATAGEA